MTAPVWIGEAFGNPGTVFNQSENVRGATSVFRKLDLAASVYSTGGWALTARDHSLQTVQNVKLCLTTPNGAACPVTGVCPNVTISAGGLVTLKLGKLSGANFVEASNSWSGPAGSYMWFEFVGLQ